MPIVDMKINESRIKYNKNIDSSKRYSLEGSLFIVHLPFANEKDEIVENEDIVFTSDRKLDIIEFINFLINANAYVRENDSEPEDVSGYSTWCDSSHPGLHSWPHKDDKYLKLTNITVKFHDYLDNIYDVDLFQL